MGCSRRRGRSGRRGGALLLIAASEALPLACSCKRGALLLVAASGMRAESGRPQEGVRRAMLLRRMSRISHERVVLFSCC